MVICMHSLPRELFLLQSFRAIGGSTSQCDTWSLVEAHKSVTLFHVNFSTDTSVTLTKCHNLVCFGSSLKWTVQKGWKWTVLRNERLGLRIRVSESRVQSGRSLKWSRESGRSWVRVDGPKSIKMDGPEVWKWTVNEFESGRSKSMKVDGP